MHPAGRCNRVRQHGQIPVRNTSCLWPGSSRIRLAPFKSSFEDRENVAGLHKRLPVGFALYGFSVVLANYGENVVHSTVRKPSSDRYRRHDRHSGLVRELPGVIDLA